MDFILVERLKYSWYMSLIIYVPMYVYAMKKSNVSEQSEKCVLTFFPLEYIALVYKQCIRQEAFKHKEYAPISIYISVYFVLLLRLLFRLKYNFRLLLPWWHYRRLCIKQSNNILFHIRVFNRHRLINYSFISIVSINW